jgi:hypothetical protein
LSWSASDSTAKATGTPIKRNVWIARGVIDDYGDAVLQRPQLYTAAVGKVGAFSLAASLECAVGDTNAGVDIPTEIAGGELYTILLTCYIEPGAVGSAGDVYLGAGMSDYNYDGIISGGWAPRIELLK